jgi:hypothetical protein
VLGQADHEAREQGAEHSAHFPLRLALQCSIDEPLNFAAFDVQRIRARLEGATEEGGDALRLVRHRVYRTAWRSARSESSAPAREAVWAPRRQSSLGAYSATAQRPGTAPAAPRWLVHMIAGTVLSDRPCASIKPSLQG